MSSLTASNLLLTLDNRSGVETLLDLAARQYAHRPDAPAVIFIPPSSDPPHTITVREFYVEAARYADALQRVDIRPRDLVILVMEHSEALLSAFWGSLMLGTIPSIFPFLSDKLDPDLRKMIARHCTWVQTFGVKGEQANFTDKDLRGFTPCPEVARGNCRAPEVTLDAAR